MTKAAHTLCSGSAKCPQVQVPTTAQMDFNFSLRDAVCARLRVVFTRESAQLRWKDEEDKEKII